MIEMPTNRDLDVCTRDISNPILHRGANSLPSLCILLLSCTCALCPSRLTFIFAAGYRQPAAGRNQGASRMQRWKPRSLPPYCITFSVHITTISLRFSQSSPLYPSRRERELPSRSYLDPIAQQYERNSSLMDASNFIVWYHM